MDVVRWYLRGIALMVRLIWTGLTGTDEEFEAAERDIDAYHAQYPRDTRERNDG